jgi:hypothetical protein
MRAEEPPAWTPPLVPMYFEQEDPAMCTTWWAPPLKEEGGGMDFLPCALAPEAIVMCADSKSTTGSTPVLETQPGL